MNPLNHNNYDVYDGNIYVIMCQYRNTLSYIIFQMKYDIFIKNNFGNTNWLIVNSTLIFLIHS